MGKHDDVEQIRDVVDSAIDGNDILPLVRLVFEGCVETVGSPTSNTSDQIATADIVKACLESMVAEESEVAAQICRGNTGTITESMEELEAVQTSAEQLRQDLMGVNADLQNAGEALMHCLNEFGELQEVEDRLLATGSALDWTCVVLERCGVACQHIDYHRLHQALQILEDIQSNMIPANDKESSKPLKGFLGKIVTELVNIVQKLAMSDFNDWLVSARAEARHIGMQAIRRAAIWRQHEENCALERNSILQAIKSGSSLQEAASLRIPTLSLVDTLSDTATRQTYQSIDTTGGHDTMSGQLNVGGLEDDHWEGGSTTVLSETSRPTLTPSRSATSVLPDPRDRHGMNMRFLHRCIHVHEKMGRMPNFREYYMQQRRMQMDSDLRPPANFLEVYQTYLAQVTGFFIIEDNVQRMASNLLEQEEVEALWEMAIATLKSVVDTAFESMSSAAAMLLVKDFLLLVCGALSKSGYPAANLKEILSSNMSKYHGLMNSHVAGEVSRIWESDELERVKIKSEKSEREYILELGLPGCLRGWDPPSQLPYRAPFTSMVPQILWLMQEYIRDSVAYLKGLTNLGDVLPAACTNRDQIIKAAVDVLQEKLHHVASNASMLKESMQLVTNTWALAHGFAKLDEWTESLVLRGGSTEQHPRKHRKSKPLRTSGSHTLAISQAAEDSAQGLLVRIVTSKIEELLGELKSWDWSPKVPPPAATSPIIEEVMIYLQGVFELSFSAMPNHNAEVLISSSMQVVGSCLMNTLAGDDIPTINEYGFQRLLGDVTALEKFADKSPVQDLGSDLVQCQKICHLLVLGKLEDGLDVQRLRQKYPDIDLSILVTVLDKYRDVGSGMSNFLASRNKAQPRRKAVETLAKQLRDRMFTRVSSQD